MFAQLKFSTLTLLVLACMAVSSIAVPVPAASTDVAAVGGPDFYEESVGLIAREPQRKVIKREEVRREPQVKKVKKSEEGDCDHAESA